MPSKNEDQIQYIVKDTVSAVKMRQVEAKAEAKRYKEVVRKAKYESKAELAKIKADEDKRFRPENNRKMSLGGPDPDDFA